MQVKVYFGEELFGTGTYNSDTDELSLVAALDPSKIPVGTFLTVVPEDGTGSFEFLVEQIEVD